MTIFSVKFLKLTNDSFDTRDAREKHAKDIRCTEKESLVTAVIRAAGFFGGSFAVVTHWKKMHPMFQIITSYGIIGDPLSPSIIR